ncbi:MAG: TMEM175 family protein [Flavobacteriales bacterium]
MKRNRLEAFSDGVLAIIITIMVLEFKIPEEASLDGLSTLLPKFFSYILSFMYVGIYWSNHHHMMFTIKEVNGKILWANLHLLFWLSLIPFATAWVGESYFAPIPVMLYGIILFMSGTAYNILQVQIIKFSGKNSTLSKAIGKAYKEKIGTFLYIIAIGLSYFTPIIAIVLYIIVAMMWWIPDKRIENIFVDQKQES